MGCSKFRMHFFSIERFFFSLGLQLGSNSSDTFPWQRCIFCELPHSKDLFRGKYSDVKVVKRKSLPKMMQHFTYLEMVNKRMHITYYMLYTYYIHIIYYSLFLYTIFTYSIETPIYDAMICSNRHLSVMQHLGSMWSFQAVWWFHRLLFHVRTILLQKNITHFQSIFFQEKKRHLYTWFESAHLGWGSLPKDPTPTCIFCVKTTSIHKSSCSYFFQLPLSFHPATDPAKSWRNVEKMAMQVSLACHFTILLPSGRQEVLSIPQELVSWWVCVWLDNWMVSFFCCDSTWS